MTPRRKALGATTIAFGIIAIAIVVAAGISFIANQSGTNPNTLAVYEETCSTGYGTFSSSICKIPNHPVNMPMTFNLSTTIYNQNGNVSTLHQFFFGVFLESGHAVRISLDSSAPTEFFAYSDNRTGFEVKSLANEVANYAHLVTNDTGITSYNNRLLARQSGWYIFVLSVKQPSPVPTATFDIQSS